MAAGRCKAAYRTDECEEERMIEIKDDDLPIEVAKKIIFAKKKTQTLIEREVEAECRELAGYKRQLQKEWIPCSERIPEEGAPDLGN